MEHIVEGKNFVDALKEALSFGFTTVETAIGTHQPIEDMIAEIESDTDPNTDDPEDYIYINHYIIRITDAWGRDAEIYRVD